MDDVNIVAQVVGPLLAALSAIGVAWMARKTKMTPEKKDATEVMQTNITLLSDRIDALEKSNQALWQDVEKLRGRVSYLWVALEAAKGYIRFLEGVLHELTGSKPERPEDVARLMDDDS